uniref:Uncharacterized protein n=1 Tax=Romanomermis culicivorax TaxID=13658 RepID=A0A915I575_ROMCU
MCCCSAYHVDMCCCSASHFDICFCSACQVIDENERYEIDVEILVDIFSMENFRYWFFHIAQRSGAMNNYTPMECMPWLGCSLLHQHWWDCCCPTQEALQQTLLTWIFFSNSVNRHSPKSTLQTSTEMSTPAPPLLRRTFFNFEAASFRRCWFLATNKILDPGVK